MAETKPDTACCAPKPRIVNLGIQTFYEALLSQGVQAVQIAWTPPARQDAETESLLEGYL
jgi:hypothetical protein